MKTTSIDVIDGENKKTIPALLLELDVVNGEKKNFELLVTSKKLIKTIKEFYDSGLLFSFFFKIKKEGSGFKTQYSFIPSKSKEAVAHL